MSLALHKPIRLRAPHLAPTIVPLMRDERERFEFWAESEGKTLAEWMIDVCSKTDEALQRAAPLICSINERECDGHQETEDDDSQEIDG